jgi:hypothetical protein
MTGEFCAFLDQMQQSRIWYQELNSSETSCDKGPWSPV